MKDGCLNDIHYSDSYETEKKNSDKKIDCCFIIRRTGAWVSTKKKMTRKKCIKSAKRLQKSTRQYTLSLPKWNVFEKKTTKTTISNQ